MHLMNHTKGYAIPRRGAGIGNFAYAAECINDDDRKNKFDTAI
jgi:hypothetical protein